ncbi:MAG: hypothetical protein ACXVA3_12540 [Vulcanimicrobiaceae bacterium]
MKHRHSIGSRLPFIAVAFSLFIALTGCGGGASGDLTSFKAPEGWKSFSVFGYSMWIAPDDQGHKGQVLMLMRLPHKSGEDLSTVTGRYRNVRVEERKTIAICGNQPAQYVELAGTQSDKRGNTREDVRIVETTYGDTVYFALYARDAGAPINNDADAAIKSLCLKK